MAASLQDQLASLVHEVAAYNASSRGRVVVPRREPDITGCTVPKDPNRFPLNVVNSDYAGHIVPDTSEPPPHLNRFKDCNFVDTSTHTRFSLHPPDGAAKPDLLRTSFESPIKYKGTLTKDKPLTKLGPGDIPWDACPQGQGLGTYINLTPASRSLSPGKDPDRTSQPFAACERPNPLAAGRTAGSGFLYKPGLPDFEVWHRCGFSTTAQLREIKAETWGTSTREPRDPNAAPPQYVSFSMPRVFSKAINRREVPAFDKRGFPADVSRQAEPAVARCSATKGADARCNRPETSCANSVAMHRQQMPRRAQTADSGLSRIAATSLRSHKQSLPTAKRGAQTFHKTYGRQGVLKLDRQMGREDRSGMRADIGQPYPDSAAMGPGTHEPSIDYHNLHLKRAQTAPAESNWGAQKLQPLVRVQAVLQVRQARQDYLEEQRRAQMKAMSAASRSRVCSKPGDMHGWQGIPPQLCREECAARMTIIAR